MQEKNTNNIGGQTASPLPLSKGAPKQGTTSQYGGADVVAPSSQKKGLEGKTNP